MSSWLRFYLGWILSVQIVLSGLTPAFALAPTGEAIAPATPAAPPPPVPTPAPSANPAPLTPAQAAAAAEANRVNAGFQKLFLEITTANERALYPTDPITRQTLGGPLSTNELEDLTSRLLAMRTSIAKFIESNYYSVQVITQTANGQTVKSTSEVMWLAAINTYMIMAETLERTRLALGQQLEPAFWSKYDLAITFDGFSLPELIQTASLRLQDSDSWGLYPMLGTRLDRKQNALIFSLNPERAIPIYSDDLATHGGVEGVKRYLAWTAYYGLYQNLAKLNQLQRRTADSLQRPSALIQAQFPIARHLHALAKRSDDRFIWQQQFDIVSKRIPNILQKLEAQNLRFVTTDFVKSMFAAAGATPGEQLDQIVKSLMVDEDANSLTQTATLLYLGATRPPQTLEQWQTIVIDAIVDFKAISQRFDRVTTEDGLTRDQQQALLQLIDKRRLELKSDPQVNAIVRADLQEIVNSLMPDRILWQQRQDLDGALVKKTADLRNIPDAINIPAWIGTRRMFFPPNPSMTIVRWVNSLTSTKSWDEAEALYENILFSYLSSFRLSKNDSSVAKKVPVPLAELASLAPNFKWDDERIANTFNVPASLRSGLAGQDPSRQQDLVDWIAIGRALMFDHPRGMTISKLLAPCTSNTSKTCQAGLTAGGQKDYDDSYRRNAMMTFPILSSTLTPDNVVEKAFVQVTARVYDNREPLWKKLSDVNAADEPVNAHLLELEKNILTDFSFIEDSLAPSTVANNIVRWAARMGGFTEQAQSLDSIKPEFLVLIEKGSMLASNINQRKVLANTFLEMQNSITQGSDFEKAFGFLNEKANYAFMFAISVAIIQGIAMSADKSKSFVGLSRMLTKWLEPAFGPNATYLQKFALYWLGGQLTYYGLQSLNQKDQLLALSEFYHSIAEVPGQKSGDDSDAIAACLLTGRCLTNNQDLLTQSLNGVQYQSKFLIGAGVWVGAITLFGGVSYIRSGMKWAATRFGDASQSMTARAQEDFSVMGYRNSDQYTFNRFDLDNKMQGTISRLDSTMKQMTALQDDTARAMAERAAAAAIEQSRARLEQMVLEEVQHWQTLTDVYMSDIKAMGLDPATWWDPVVYSRRLTAIENSNLSETEMADVLRSRRNLDRLMQVAQTRIQTEPLYEKLLQGALKRNGVDLQKEFETLGKIIDPRVHMSNLLRTSKGDFTLAPDVPIELQKMVQVMVDNNIVGSSAAADPRLLSDFVRAIQKSITWEAR